MSRRRGEGKSEKKANPRAGGRARLMIPFGDVAASDLCKRPRYAIFSFSLSRERAHTSATKPWRDGRANNNEDNQSAVGRKGILWRGQDGRGGKYVGRTNTPLPSSFRRPGSSLSVRSTSQPVLRAFMHFHQRDDRETKVLKRTRARFKSVNDGLILPLPRLTG